ncbi:MAG TPA: cytidylate kinase-like family protein [Gemmataceae bacterium]|nr:cytidylate kinase-like family protein [Gemmataceae bacterium]
MSPETLFTDIFDPALSELAERAWQHWEAKRLAAAAAPHIESSAPHAFSIALSREIGTQASAVAQELGRLLGWQVYDRQLLEKIAQDMGLRADLLESVDERRQSWRTEIVRGLMAVPYVTEGGFAHHLIETVLALGTHGECVFVGRGSAFILPPATTLRVRLIGSVPERVAAWSQMLGISEQKAAEQIRDLDRVQTDFLKYYFHKDPADPYNYDLVLNAPRLSVVQLAELIVEAYRRLVARQEERSRGKPSS